MFIYSLFPEDSGHKHSEPHHEPPKEKHKEKTHVHKSEHHKSKSEHEHAKQTLKLLTELHNKHSNTPIAERLKQQVQQHTGKQKHILPVVPKKLSSKPVVHFISKPIAKSQQAMTQRLALARKPALRKPAPKVRIVYVPSNQTAQSLVKQGPMHPFYKISNRQTPLIGGNQRTAPANRIQANRPQASLNKQLPNMNVQNSHNKANVHQPFAQLPLGAPNIAAQAPVRPINTEEIFRAFPQLRASGVTEDILRDLNNRVPNLEQKIRAHFMAHRNKPALYSNSIHHDLAASNLAFMKNYHEAVQNQKLNENFNSLQNSRNIEGNQAKFGLNAQDLSELSSLNNNLKQQAGVGITQNAQNFANPNFQSTAAGLQNSLMKSNPELAAGYKGLSPLSLQRFRQESVPETAYKSGNFEKQTNQPGLVFLPGEQLTAYGYNQSMSRGILPQPLRPSWQPQNRLTSFYTNDQYSNNWSAFTTCTSTCGRGMKKRYRKCGIPDCPSGGVEIETLPCISRPCAGMVAFHDLYRTENSERSTVDIVFNRKRLHYIILLYIISYYIISYYIISYYIIVYYIILYYIISYYITLYYIILVTCKLQTCGRVAESQ